MSCYWNTAGGSLTMSHLLVNQNPYWYLVIKITPYFVRFSSYIWWQILSDLNKTKVQVIVLCFPYWMEYHIWHLISNQSGSLQVLILGSLSWYRMTYSWCLSIDLCWRFVSLCLICDRHRNIDIKSYCCIWKKKSFNEKTHLFKWLLAILNETHYTP